jgi:hypothetical protein
MMSFHDRYNVASVSKTITAAALLRALLDSSQASLDSPFAPFLPSHWGVHNSLKNITFRQLLQHRSGFRFANQVTYAAMKGNMAAGVNAGNIGSYDYNNVNYGIMRLLIPRLAGYNLFQLSPGTPSVLAPALESGQDLQLASCYIDYTQKKVWDKAGAPPMACKPTDNYPALCYQFPPNLGKGTHFGDMTLTCGSRGWNASSVHLNAFQRALHLFNAILPESLAKKMIDEQLGYDGSGTTKNAYTYYHKGGYYPGSMNPGELHSYIIGFSNGVQLALIINSQFDGPDDLLGTVIQAFDAAYPLFIHWPIG